MNFFIRSDGRLRAGWRVLLGIVIAIAANVLAAVLASSWRTGDGGAFELGFETIYRPLLVAFLIGGFSLLEIFADQVEERPLAAQGFPRRRAGREFLLGLAIGAGLITFSVGIMAVVGQVSLQPASGVSAGPLFGLLLMLLAAALTEELMFRGYPFQRLVEAMGAVPAILVLSFLFGYAHSRNPHVSVLAIANTLLVGILLAVAYLRTRALWLPWGIHFAWNATLGVAFGLPVSGLNFAAAVQGTAVGPVWLTGGDYGLEGSLLATFVILLGFLPVVKFVPKLPASTPELQVVDGISSNTGHPNLEGSARPEEHAQQETGLSSERFLPPKQVERSPETDV